MPFICSAVYYYNESNENNRMYRIKRILKGNDRYGKRVVKYELQNELVVSAMFCLHVIILSILGVVYSLDIDKHLNEHVKDYFSIYNVNKSLEYTASLAITTLSLDLLVIVVLLVFVKVVVQVKGQNIFQTLISYLYVHGGIVPTVSSFLSASLSTIQITLL